jgi:hypothetical protein
MCASLSFTNFQIMFYLPLYFQSVKGTSAITSGVYNLPTVAFFSLGSMVTGGLMGKTRLIVPFQLASGLLATLGAALIYSLDVDSSKAWFIGSQIPFGFGIGLGNQVPMTALQSFANPADLSVIMGIVFSRLPYIPLHRLTVYVHPTNKMQCVNPLLALTSSQPHSPSSLTASFRT